MLGLHLAVVALHRQYKISTLLSKTNRIGDTKCNI